MTKPFRLRQGPVDVHSHLTPAAFPENAHGETKWPCMHRKSAIDATIFIGDKPFRQLDERSWAIKRRLEDMDRDGVAAQVLSPMPELLSYWFEGPAAEQLCDYVNADLAAQIALVPDRFAGLGTVPMQDPNLAIRHLERVKNVFNLSGVEIGSNINGELLGSPRFEEFFRVAEDLDLAIFVHALHPIATHGLELHSAYTPMVGFPVDTAMAAASLILSGTMERYPHLRIGFSHGGGALAPIVHRLEFGWQSTRGFGETVAVRPSETAAKMFFDSNVYDPTYLRYICEHLAPGRVFMGTDYPYVIMQPDPVAFVSQTGLQKHAQESLFWGAAHTFLGLSGNSKP